MSDTQYQFFTSKVAVIILLVAAIVALGIVWMNARDSMNPALPGVAGSEQPVPDKDSEAVSTVNNVVESNTSAEQTLNGDAQSAAVETRLADTARLDAENVPLEVVMENAPEVAEAQEASGAVQPAAANAAAEAAAPPVEGNVPEAAEAAAPAERAPAVLAPFLLLDPNDRFVVWTASGAVPGQHLASAPGRVALMDMNGALTPLVDAPAPTNRIEPCGDDALSPDGTMFFFYIGTNDEGKIYLMRGMDAPVVVDDVNYLACLGSGTFTFSPNGGRFAYIDYETGAAVDTFADGFLKIYNSADMTEQKRFENATAFALTNDGAAIVQFYTNNKQEADEAAIVWWDGSSDREIATLNPEEDCEFTSARVAVQSSGNLVLMMGHRCKQGDGRTQWQLYTVNREARSVSLAASDFQPAVFASFARTNNIFFSPDSGTLFFTVPDGVVANTVAIAAVNLASLDISVPVNRQVLFPTFRGVTQALPQISPDGKWLAGVITSPNNDNQLFVLDLSKPTAAPILINAGSRGDIISALAFTPDSARLIYVAGGAGGGDNSLFALLLASGAEERIRRGRFAQGFVMSPDGTQVALLDWQIPEKDNEPSYTHLIVVDLATGDVTTVFEGADITATKDVENLRFAYPLLWKRS